MIIVGHHLKCILYLTKCIAININGINKQSNHTMWIQSILSGQCVLPHVLTHTLNCSIGAVASGNYRDHTDNCVFVIPPGSQSGWIRCLLCYDMKDVKKKKICTPPRDTNRNSSLLVLGIDLDDLMWSVWIVTS